MLGPTARPLRPELVPGSLLCPGFRAKQLSMHRVPRGGKSVVWALIPPYSPGGVTHWKPDPRSIWRAAHLPTPSRAPAEPPPPGLGGQLKSPPGRVQLCLLICYARRHGHVPRLLCCCHGLSLLLRSANLERAGSSDNKACSRLGRVLRPSGGL